MSHKNQQFLRSCTICIYVKLIDVYVVSVLDTSTVKSFTENPFSPSPSIFVTAITSKSFTVDPFTTPANNTKAFREDSLAHTDTANDPFIPTFSFDAQVPELSTNKASAPASDKYANLSGLFDESNMSNSVDGNVVKSFEAETAAFKSAVDQLSDQDFPTTFNLFRAPQMHTTVSMISI